MEKQATTTQQQLEVIWGQCQPNIVKVIGEAAYKHWISSIFIEAQEGNEIILTAPTRFIREWVISNYKSLIIASLKQQDSSICGVDILVRKVDEETKSTTDNIVVDFHNREDALSAPLDRRFTFENFIVGKPNEFAYASARAVAESSNVLPEMNPLFLYGGVGLGKTHLMHAIAWYIRQEQPKRKVIYLSAEKFMYLFVKALRNKDMMAFKEQIRSVDVLMIDDVQFICGKDSTQEEFFHTLNALMDNGKQLIISADRSPSDLNGLEERIRSRLGWGLVADLNPSTYELRLGILQSKVTQMDIEVPEDIVAFLAKKITSNIRELEGALNKVVAHARVRKEAVSLESVGFVLSDLLRSYERIITVEDIQKQVAQFYNVRISDMSSKRRLRSIARPRQIAMYIAKQLTTLSLFDIGKHFGGKDHTTILHAVKRIEQLCIEEPDIRQDVETLVNALRVSK